MIEKLNKLYDEGLLQKQVHPNLPLIVWNYTKKVQFEKLWKSDELLTQCRGLITDVDGNIISRCLSKFFNYEELDYSDIPKEPFDIYEKMDGSYINLFSYKNEWIFASRGSFISDQAILAKKVFNDKYLNAVSLHDDRNYVMELIGKDNMIVIYYPENDLILLTSIITENNEESNIYDKMFDGFNRVKKYDVSGITNLTELRKIDGENREGFVIRFRNGFRVKIKYQEYCRLHSIITNVSNLSVWRHLKVDGDFAELLENVPDEFYKWLNDTVFKFRADYNAIELDAYKEFVRIYHKLGFNTRKEFALEALKSEHRGILFKIYEDRTYGELIWKQLRPVFEKPFSENNYT